VSGPAPEPDDRIVARWFPPSRRATGAGPENVSGCSGKLDTSWTVDDGRRWLLVLVPGGDPTHPNPCAQIADRRWHLVDTVGAVGYPDIGLAGAADVVATSAAMRSRLAGRTGSVERLEVRALDLGRFAVSAVLYDGTRLPVGCVSDLPPTSVWAVTAQGGRSYLQPNLVALAELCGLDPGLALAAVRKRRT
jgi:hypothetical protein